MNKELLIEVGQALYGERWQTDMSKALDINVRRVRQWLNDERPIPDWLGNELKNLLSNNQKKCEELKSKINT